MPTYSKIPKKVKAKGCTASGRYCVFEGLLKAGAAFVELERAEARGSIPMVGFITIKGVRYYYCLYGLVDDPNIYAK